MPLSRATGAVAVLAAGVLAALAAFYVLMLGALVLVLTLPGRLVDVLVVALAALAAALGTATATWLVYLQAPLLGSRLRAAKLHAAWVAAAAVGLTVLVDVAVGVDDLVDRGAVAAVALGPVVGLAVALVRSRSRRGQPAEEPRAG